MSKIKEYYFEEINNLNQENFDDVEYEIWLRKQEDLYYQKLYEENKEIIEGEKILNKTRSYGF